MPRGGGLVRTSNRKAAGSIRLLLAKCRGVLLPSVRAGCRLAWLTPLSVYEWVHEKSCLNLRMYSVGVADRLADSQGQQGLVAGVGQGVDGF